MTRLGIPVPAGFTITTEACIYYTSNKMQYPQGMWKQVEDALKKLEKAMGASFGDPSNPLLVSVRSGARVSMPGMMDTVLNLGLNDASLKGLIAKTKNERFAYDSYRRFIQMFSDVVLGIEKPVFERLIEAKKHAKKVKLDTELTAEDLKELVELFKRVFKDKTGKDFPQEPKEQLKYAINAVFGSWDNQRAVTYRKLNKIPGDWGTAVNVQAMAYGNMGENSGTGVAFTRDPGTGEKRFFGEYLINAQGEDVVAGVRTPVPIAELKKQMPKIYAELEAIYKRLEKHYRDMQDIEFTIQEGKLYMLQCRVGQAHRGRGREDRRGPGEGEADQQGGGRPARRPGSARPAPAPPRGSRRPSRRRSPRACRRRPARPSARPCSPRPRPRRWRPRGSGSSWCASRPRPRTSAA